MSPHHDYGTDSDAVDDQWGLAFALGAAFGILAAAAVLGAAWWLASV